MTGRRDGDRPRVEAGEDNGRRELRVGGVVQSVDLHSALAGEYWPAMLPERRPERALLLGAGGGTLAALLQQRFGPLPVIAVDDDPTTVAIGRRAFYLDLSGVQVILADAFQFAASTRGRFDYIAVDLFRAGERARGVTGRPFLRDLARLAEPRGIVVFNLYRDRRLEQAVTRIARVLTVVRRVPAGKNVAVHCRA